MQFNWNMVCAKNFRPFFALNMDELMNYALICRTNLRRWFMDGPFHRRWLLIESTCIATNRAFIEPFDGVVFIKSTLCGCFRCEHSKYYLLWRLVRGIVYRLNQQNYALFMAYRYLRCDWAIEFTLMLYFFCASFVSMFLRVFFFFSTWLLCVCIVFWSELHLPGLGLTFVRRANEWPVESLLQATMTAQAYV